MSSKRTTYNTEDELDYIKRISESTRLGKTTTRLEKLQLYKQSASQREKWDKINKDTVFKFVDHLISGELIKEEKKNKKLKEKNDKKKKSMEGGAQ